MTDWFLSHTTHSSSFNPQLLLSLVHPSVSESWSECECWSLSILWLFHDIFDGGFVRVLVDHYRYHVSETVRLIIIDTMTFPWYLWRRVCTRACWSLSIPCQRDRQGQALLSGLLKKSVLFVEFWTRNISWYLSMISLTEGWYESLLTMIVTFFWYHHFYHLTPQPSKFSNLSVLFEHVVETMWRV